MFYMFFFHNYKKKNVCLNMIYLIFVAFYNCLKIEVSDNVQNNEENSLNKSDHLSNEKLTTLNRRDGLNDEDSALNNEKTNDNIIAKKKFSNNLSENKDNLDAEKSNVKLTSESNEDKKTNKDNLNIVEKLMVDKLNEMFENLFSKFKKKSNFLTQDNDFTLTYTFEFDDKYSDDKYEKEQLSDNLNGQIYVQSDEKNSSITKPIVVSKSEHCIHSNNGIGGATCAKNLSRVVSEYVLHQENAYLSNSELPQNDENLETSSKSPESVKKEKLSFSNFTDHFKKQKNKSKVENIASKDLKHLKKKSTKPSSASEHEKELTKLSNFKTPSNDQSTGINLNKSDSDSIYSVESDKYVIKKESLEKSEKSSKNNNNSTDDEKKDSVVNSSQ